MCYLCSFKIWKSQTLIYFFTRTKYFYLPHMGVFTRMLVLQNDYLNVYCRNVVFLCTVQQLRLQWNCVPTARLLQLQILHLLQILHIVTRTHRYLWWGITLIRFKIEKHTQLLNSFLFHKLDVNQMRLGTIWLPKCISIIISQLFNPISHLGWRQSPNSLFPDLPSNLIIGRWSSTVHVG